MTCAAFQCATASEDAFFAELNSPDPDVRIAAVRALQTSLDPRIPDAMLPLLADEGNSIRRLAARAIGSRWWQIPKEKVPQFITALRRNENSDFDDERNMVARAIGLMTRDYTSKMFACSANKHWVIYERRWLPCLIDTKTDTEELLDWPRDETLGLELFLPAIGNELLHPKGVIEEPNPITAEIEGWKGNELHVSVGWGRDGNSAVVALDLSKNSWRIVSAR